MIAAPEPILRAPEHLNSSGCTIKTTVDKGRGVYASRLIHRNTIVEISPVLFFSKEEYEAHGRHTIVDHYTFKWPDGRMALALGLGSIFNHSDPPNLSYVLDAQTNSIRYTTVRDVNPGEELCIFYGHKLWFNPVDGPVQKLESLENDDGWEGDQEEIILEEDLPFTRFKLPPEEEDAQSIRTVPAWVVDIPEPRHITTLLKWLKQAGLDGPELGHLKRIRKQGELTSLLITIGSDPPEPPLNLNLPPPYLLPVPVTSAFTLPSLHLKTALWPTMYTPRRKDEPEPWTRGKLKWAWDAMRKTVAAAVEAQTNGDELPIAAHIPAAHCNSLDDDSSFTATDTRNSTRHPLRHATINVIRKIADYRASQAPQTGDVLSERIQNTEDVQNGSNYLLTDRTFFITHEPCIMCSMALLHSRVKEVIYLYPMAQTGGCGGCTCLPTLKGVNHRFGILHWNSEGQYSQFSEKDIQIEATIDV